MSSSCSYVKEEFDDETEDATDEETCLPENGQNETSLLDETDPLDLLLLKAEALSDEEQNNTTAKSIKKSTEKNEIFRCEICKDVLFKKQKFLQHKYSHTYDVIFTCLMCHYVFKTKLGIVDHILVFHRNLLQFGCNICNVRFATQKKLDKHRLNHKNIPDLPFKCGLCSLRFITKTSLNTHKMTHSIKRSISCDICHRQCASIVALANHKRTHELVKCDKCPKLFDRNNLNRHKKKEHSIGLYKCDICLKTFDDNVALNTHKFSHIGQSITFECTICHKKFDSMKKRNKHELIHNKEKIYECDKCCKRYQYFSQLQKHYRDHPDHTNNKEVNKDKIYKPIECNICHKRYTQLMGLRNHMKTHTKQKDYKCDICHKSFYTKYVLRDHLRVHTGEKPFKCKLCPKKFRTGTNLNYHLATHSKDNKFECAMCNKQYARKGKLLEHIRKIHLKNNGNQHKIKNKIRFEQVTVKMNINNTRKQRERISKSIVIMQEEPKFECNICHRRFKLKHSLLLHETVHKKDGNYDCDICYKHFEGKQQLEKHKKVHNNKKFNTKQKEEATHTYTLICNNVMRTVVNPLSLKGKRETL